MKSKNMIVINLLIAVSFVLIGCNKDSIQSIWNDQQLIIDGFYADWGSRLLYNEKSNVGFGVANDSTDLYICLVSADQQMIRQVMMNGLELEIDIPKTKNHLFKIKYPVGMDKKDMSSMPGMRPGGAPGSGSFGDEMGQPQRGRRPKDEGMNWSETQGQMPKIEDIQTEFHLYGPGKDDKRIIPMRNTMGIDIKVGQSQRQIVYELRLPFKIIQSYFQIDPDVSISQLDLKFKMPDSQRSTMASRDDGGMGGPPGGGGGMGAPPGGGGMGGPPGGGGGMGSPPGSGEMDNSVSQNFKFNVRVLLADSQ